MNERTIIGKIRTDYDGTEFVHAAIVREGPFTGSNKDENVYLSHFSMDETERSPIIFEDMENCAIGADSDEAKV